MRNRIQQGETKQRSNFSCVTICCHRRDFEPRMQCQQTCHFGTCVSGCPENSHARRLGFSRFVFNCVDFLHRRSEGRKADRSWSCRGARGGTCAFHSTPTRLSHSSPWRPYRRRNDEGYGGHDEIDSDRRGVAVMRRVRARSMPSSIDHS